jgi:endonuclease/exonuclease/phosphatase family metal-dependent hydrolase
MQEVDHYHDALAPAMEARGYRGLFLPKARQPDADGCALFYADARFRVHTVEELEYGTRLPPPQHTSRQVALIAVLAPRSAAAPSDPALLPEGSLCVATTHLKSATEYETFRLAQAGVLAAELAALRVRHPRLPLIVAADMNTEPTGPVYALLATVRARGPQSRREGRVHAPSLTSLVVAHT